MPSTTSSAWYNGSTLNTNNTLSGFNGDGGEGGGSGLLAELFRLKREQDDYNWMKQRIWAGDEFKRGQNAANLDAKRQLEMMRQTRDPLADKKNRFEFERAQILEKERRAPIPVTGHTAPNATGVWYRPDYLKMNPTQRAQYNPSGSGFGGDIDKVDARASLSPELPKKEDTGADQQLQYMRNLFIQNPTAYGLKMRGGIG